MCTDSKHCDTTYFFLTKISHDTITITEGKKTCIVKQELLKRQDYCMGTSHSILANKLFSFYENEKEFVLLFEILVLFVRYQWPAFKTRPGDAILNKFLLLPPFFSTSSISCLLPPWFSVFSPSFLCIFPPPHFFFLDFLVCFFLVFF